MADGGAIPDLLSVIPEDASPAWFIAFAVGVSAASSWWLQKFVGKSSSAPPPAASPDEVLREVRALRDEHRRAADEVTRLARDTNTRLQVMGARQEARRTEL